MASDSPTSPVTGFEQTQHIALLLPTGSKIYGKYATALRDRFLAAKQRDRQILPLRSVLRSWSAP